MISFFLFFFMTWVPMVIYCFHSLNFDLKNSLLFILLLSKPWYKFDDKLFITIFFPWLKWLWLASFQLELYTLTYKRTQSVHLVFLSFFFLCFNQSNMIRHDFYQSLYFLLFCMSHMSLFMWGRGLKFV